MPEQKSGDVRTPPIPFPSRGPTTTNEGRQLKDAVLTATAIDRRLREVAPLPCTMGEAEVVLARTIGAEIARWREARGWSQIELAEMVGCDRSAVSRWEAGRRLPSLSHLVALGQALGCGARALLPADAPTILPIHLLSEDGSADRKRGSARCVRTSAAICLRWTDRDVATLPVDEDPT